MLISSIDHVQLTAPPGSEERLRTFYSDILGLKEIPKPSGLKAYGGLWFDGGNLALHIGIEDAPHNESSRRHIAFRVDDLERVRAALTAHHIAIEEDERPAAGWQRFYCRDAVGNRLEFLLVESEARSAGVDLRPWLARPEQVAEYDVSSGAIERAALSADGVWLAAGTSIEDPRAQAPLIHLWRYGQPGEPEVEIELVASPAELAFSPNGRELACLSTDGSLETWRVEAGDFESDQFTEHPEGSAGLAYSDDNGLLAVGAKDTVKLYRPGLDELHIIRPGLGGIHALAFDPHGTLAVSGQAARIQLWQVRPVQRSAWEVLGHEAPALQLRFNPLHAVLAALLETGEVLVWDINEGPEAPKAVGAAIEAVNAIAFSPDGGVLACGGEAGRVWLWDWQAERMAAQFDVGAEVVALAFAPDGTELIVGGADGRVRVWKVR